MMTHIDKLKILAKGFNTNPTHVLNTLIDKAFNEFIVGQSKPLPKPRKISDYQS